MKMRNRCPDCGIRYTSELELALHECAPTVLVDIDEVFAAPANESAES